jgi:hypothetical protein
MVAGILLILIFGMAFCLMPLWVIWTVQQLFGVDWSAKYWAVFSLLLIIGILFNSNRKG